MRYKNYKGDKPMKFLIPILSLLLLSACTWINENTEGRVISVLTANNVTSCQKAGDIEVSVASTIGFIHRSKTKVQKELLVLAKNEAVKLKANTIVSMNKPIKGAQQYSAYRCTQ